MRIFALSISILVVASQSPGFATSVTKTFRADHGRPVVVVSEKGVLLFELATEPIKDALVAHEEKSVRHCRAKYRFRSFDGATGSITNGHGTLKEVYRTVSESPTGRQVEDAGSETSVNAGQFHVWWSEASAGSRSWLYYRITSAIRFMQQPKDITFDSVDAAMFRRYLESRNVQEFVAAGRAVQVIGPASFTGDLPDDRPASGRIESCGIRENAFELRLADLKLNTSYVIERSYDVKAGNWNAVHSFIAREAAYSWSDPVGTDVTIAFYRIRAGNGAS